jgi:predicted PurR-regulated permease PerM
MKRVNLFLIVLIVSIAALIASTAIGFAIFAQTQNSNNWMSQMFGAGNNGGGMGGMMGQTGTPQAASDAWLPYFGVLFAVLITVTVVGIVGVAYYLVYPQIKMGVAQPMVSINPPAPSNANAYESVSKTLTEEERKIIDVLNSHNGKYLQKYIKNETGLSRLKTHRIIARLAERGIVSLEKTGNTNQVYLANWLNQKT